jgi:hypothetical protein
MGIPSLRPEVMILLMERILPQTRATKSQGVTVSKILGLTLRNRYVYYP